jgi:hypothetical protein
MVECTLRCEERTAVKGIVLNGSQACHFALAAAFSYWRLAVSLRQADLSLIRCVLGVKKTIPQVRDTALNLELIFLGKQILCIFAVGSPKSEVRSHILEP